MNRKTSLPLLALCVSACAPQLTPQEAAVYVVPYADLPPSCTFLGQVRSTGDLLGSVAFGARDGAINDLKREVAALGGDTVTISGPARGASALGDAYRCTSYI